MPFDSIPGQTRAIRMLQQSLRQGKRSHAYIFSGPSGSGRKQTAIAFAQAIYCTERTDDACGQCLECRKVSHGNHPDLIVIEPDGASIKIDQIRELQQDLSYKSTTRQTKIYILLEADRMTIPAANSLLKFLEEPQSDVMAILITTNGHALLPTIRSRAQWVPFLPLPPAQALGVLKEEGQPAALAATAVHLAAGIDAARELIQSNWFAEARNVVLQLIKEAFDALPQAMLTLQGRMLKGDLSDHLQPMLDMLVLGLKDMIHHQCGRIEQLVYGDQADWMARVARTRDMGFWVRSMERAVELKKRLRMNANAQLAFEQYLIELQGV